MNEKNQDLLTIGEMARLCRTTKDTLYFYERKGYLKPCFIDTNGYRYYDSKNFYSMDMFLSLREAGSSVEEIGEYLRVPDPENYVAHMQQKKHDIREKIADLVNLEGRISESITLTQEGLYRKPGEIFVEQMPKQYLVYKYCANQNEPKIFLECFMSTLEAVKSHHVPYDFHLSAFISRERFASGDYDPDYFYAASPIEISGDDVLIRPESKFVSLVHSGSYDDLVQHYPRMLQYIKERGFRITGNTYEQTLIGWLNSTDVSQYRTKLSIQIAE